MSRKLVRRGGSIIEVATVLLMLGALLLVFLPAVASSRTEAERAWCLSNLRRIGAATQYYASADSKEFLLPIHMMMINIDSDGQPTGAEGLDYWLQRAANAFSWGGYSATDTFFVVPGAGYYLSDQTPLPPGALMAMPEYATQHRPLTPFMDVAALDPDSGDSPFACPSDVGYPESPYIADFPAYANGGRPVFTNMGNSYRANIAGIYPAPPPSPYYEAFATGPLGQRRSTIADAAHLVLIADPLFFTQLQETEPNNMPPEVWTGWHGTPNRENVLYCDGSARPTLSRPNFAGIYPGYDPNDPSTPQVCGPPRYGIDWKLHRYPTGGTVLWGGFWQWYAQDCDLRWPFNGYTYVNPPPGAPAASDPPAAGGIAPATPASSLDRQPAGRSPGGMGPYPTPARNPARDRRPGGNRR